MLPSFFISRFTEFYRVFFLLFLVLVFSGGTWFFLLLNLLISSSFFVFKAKIDSLRGLDRLLLLFFVVVVVVVFVAVAVSGVWCSIEEKGTKKEKKPKNKKK